MRSRAQKNIRPHNIGKDYFLPKELYVPHWVWIRNQLANLYFQWV